MTMGCQESYSPVSTLCGYAMPAPKPLIQRSFHLNYNLDYYFQQQSTVQKVDLRDLLHRHIARGAKLALKDDLAHVAKFPTSRRLNQTVLRAAVNAGLLPKMPVRKAKRVPL